MAMESQRLATSGLAAQASLVRPAEAVAQICKTQGTATAGLKSGGECQETGRFLLLCRSKCGDVGALRSARRLDAEHKV